MCEYWIFSSVSLSVCVQDLLRYGEGLFVQYRRKEGCLECRCPSERENSGLSSFLCIFFLRLLCSNQSIHIANVGRREKKEKRKRAFVGRKLSVDKYVNARCCCETSPLPSKHFGPTLDANTWVIRVRGLLDSAPLEEAFMTSTLFLLPLFLLNQFAPLTFN